MRRIHPQADRRKRLAGYSLLELSVVVLILGIMALVVIPDSAPTSQQKLDLAAQEFAEAMRFARGEAIRTGELRGFLAESNYNRIRVFRLNTGTNPWTPIYDVHHPVSKKIYDIGLDSNSFARVDSMGHNRVYRGVCNLPNHVYFDGNGISRCIDPETVLLERFDLTFTLGTHTRVVSLNGITGRVTVQ